MTYVYNDPKTFMEDMLSGFLDAYGPYVVGVPGGVVRATVPPAGKVAVVVGGGSGHYPAFCGVVGPGFAHGAVVGNIFTSPSTEDAYNVAKAASAGGGVLFSTGNYAGDVMNFNLAQDRLIAEGIDTRNVYVTDDIASAPLTEVGKRRGIAGDFVVFKVAGAAADAGYSLDEVERLARHANDRTRTMGVAFDGCTMPGSTDALFHVPAGQMGVGLGIHGEPGIAEEELPRAATLAKRLVDAVLTERPADGSGRVGVILNGLGATKYEELFVLWANVSSLLRAAGLTLVDPEVGELVTSLDMAGCSLTLVFLDEELERFWTAPADTPAFRKGAVNPEPAGLQRDTTAVEASSGGAVPAGSPASQGCANTILRSLEAMSETLKDAEAELARMDSVAGDGDHGRGMVKGITFALEAARPIHAQHAGAAAVLDAAGAAWAAKAGGTSGVLWGKALVAMGRRLGDEAERISLDDVVGAVRAGALAIQALGKAQVGDKTMLDALFPFADALAAASAAGQDLPMAWASAAHTAQSAAANTAGLRPRIGRARPLADRSVGTPDPGATSLAMCLRTVAAVLADAPVRVGEA